MRARPRSRQFQPDGRADGAELPFRRHGPGPRHRPGARLCPLGRQWGGNFFVDATRSTLYILLPLCLVTALALVAMGIPQTLDGSVRRPRWTGRSRTISVGPVASQIAIKQLGTNGGGFFNANAAHPFENPPPSPTCSRSGRCW